MTKSRIILFLIAIIATIGIYQLPRVVVDDKKEKVELSEPLKVEDDHTPANRVISEELSARITEYKEFALHGESIEKRVIFADSLAEAFKNIFFYDSAAYYLEIIAKELKSEKGYRKAGDAFFDAFNFTVSESKRNNLGRKVQEYYEKVLELNPDDLDAKANMAVTFVTSAAPMQGITVLREILEKEPTHEKALFNLGLLSITSGQFDRAVERFNTLLLHHPGNFEAMLYLGYSYLELGKEELAREQFERILSSEAEETLKETANSYLESIK